MAPRSEAHSAAEAQRERTINELHQTVGRIEGKIDTFIAQMATQDERTTGLEVRTRKVEGRLHWYSGAGALLGAALSAIGLHGLAGAKF